MWSGPLSSYDLLCLVGWAVLTEREGDRSPAWGKDRTWHDRVHVSLNNFSRLPACPWACFPSSPGTGWPRIFPLCPHREELSVVLCHKGNYIQAALGMTCCERCEAAGFAYRENKIKQKTLLFLIHGSYPMALPLTRPCSPQGVFCVAVHQQSAAFPPELLYSSYCSQLPFPFNSRQQREDRRFRTRGKAGQSLREEKSESFLVGTLPFILLPPLWQRDVEQKIDKLVLQGLSCFWLQIPSPS